MRISRTSAENLYVLGGFLGFRGLGFRVLGVLGFRVCRVQGLGLRQRVYWSSGLGFTLFRCI